MDPFPSVRDRPQVRLSGFLVAGATLVIVLLLVLGAVDVKGQRALLDDSGLTRAGFVARRIAGAAGDGSGLEGVARDLGAQPGQRRGEHLVGMAARPAAATLA